jgi:stage II sporulation protein D
MRRITFFTLLLVLVALPAAASAASTRFVVKGRGFGHGIGMSQYGADGFAQHGWDYRQILAHYYTGTDLGQSSTRTVRVLLQDGRSSISFDGATKVGGKGADPNTRYKAKPTAGGVKVSHLGTLPLPLAVTSAGGAVRVIGTADNGVSSGAYRGGLEVRPGSTRGLMAVNTVDLDGYVKGVVPGEVPASWPAEALKAQAVAARTYALATDAGGTSFDQYADTRSQMYKGLESEATSSSSAVDATSGQVVKYQGHIAVTYFFSTSGGETEDVENVFYGSTPEPYLRAVSDPYDGIAPRHSWHFTYTRRQLESKLRGLVKGHFRTIKIVRRGASPRVVSAQVVGTKGTTTTDGVTLRSRLGLYDTWFTFQVVKKKKAKAVSHRGASDAAAARVARAIARAGGA